MADALDSGFTPDDVAAPTNGWRPLIERADRIGHLVWVQRQVFERLGAWAGSTGVDEIDVAYGDASRRHGWHAQVLFDRLPELSVVDAESLVRSPGPHTTGLFSHLATLDGAPAAHRWWVSHRVVLPLIVTTMRAEAASLSPTAEPSLMRWLRILVDDHVDELLSGDAIARRLVAVGDDITDVLGAQAAAERLAHATGLLLR